MQNPKLMAQLGLLNKQRKLQGLPSLTTEQGARVVKYMAEYEEIERQRRAEGLPPLTIRQAARRGVIDGQHDAAERQRHAAKQIVLPIKLGLGLFLLAAILAVLGEVLLR